MKRLIIILLLLFPSLSFSYEIHLKNGSIIETNKYWEEGSKVIYTKKYGSAEFKTSIEKDTINKITQNKIPEKNKTPIKNKVIKTKRYNNKKSSLSVSRFMMDDLIIKIRKTGYQGDIPDSADEMLILYYKIKDGKNVENLKYKNKATIRLNRFLKDTVIINIRKTGYTGNIPDNSDEMLKLLGRERNKKGRYNAPKQTVKKKNKKTCMFRCKQNHKSCSRRCRTDNNKNSLLYGDQPYDDCMNSGFSSCINKYTRCVQKCYE